MKSALTCFLVMLMGAAGWAHGTEFSARIIAVLDGDTALIRKGSGVRKIRLAEIDAPEKAQAFGEASRRSLSELVAGKQAIITSASADQYGRLVAHLNVEGMNVNAEQIRRGMAWEYSNFHSNKTLIALQNAAKQERRGLWIQHNPFPPWQWRKLHPATQSGAIAIRVADTSNNANTSCSKKLCSEMSSCEEAKYYLAQCGVKSLDGDGDGLPCEILCMPVN